MHDHIGVYTHPQRSLSTNIHIYSHKYLKKIEIVHEHMPVTCSCRHQKCKHMHTKTNEQEIAHTPACTLAT